MPHLHHRAKAPKPSRQLPPCEKNRVGSATDVWSTDDPPDIVEGTEPICDVEAAFGIRIDEDEALELYDMNLDEAARKILEMRGKKS